MQAIEIGAQVLAGERSIVDAFETDGRLVVVTTPDDWDGLSERQIDVCRLVAQGHADKWIGYELGIARSTVATHLWSALNRLNLSARTDLARVWPVLEGTCGTRSMALDFRGETYVALICDAAPLVIEGLTGAEQDVMSQAIRGASNAAIAAARGTSTRTVANQLAAIYRKLGICSRSELAVHAATAA